MRVSVDLRIGRRLHNLNDLQDAARAINDRLLHTERAGQGCVHANPVFERIAHPTVDAAGRRATAMRFGDSRVQALAGALCVTVGAVTGITNRSLRALMTGLPGTPYSMAQASYDLARLSRNQLITRRPHANTYDLTPTGWPSPSSAPRSTTGSSPRCSPPGNRRPHRNSGTPYTPSSATSTSASPTQGRPPQPDKLSSTVGVIAPKGR